MYQPKNTPKRKTRPTVAPGGVRPATFAISDANRRQLEESALRLRMRKSEVVRAAIEDLWAKTLTSAPE